MLVLEGKEHLIRVDEDYETGRITLVIFRGSIGGTQIQTDSGITLNDYDHDSLLHKLQTMRDIRYRRQKDEIKPV